MTKLKTSPTEIGRRIAPGPTHQATRPAGRVGERTSSGYHVVAGRAHPSAGSDRALPSEAAWGAVLVRFASVIVIRPAAAMGRLLLGPQSNHMGGPRRTGYPEIEYWLAGRRYPFDQ